MMSLRPVRERRPDELTRREELRICFGRNGVANADEYLWDVLGDMNFSATKRSTSGTSVDPDEVECCG